MPKRMVYLMMLVLLVSLSVTVTVAQEDRLQIVASHSILADAVQQVAGDAADVISIMPLGADPHTFVPVPSDLTTLADADVVFINGAFFEEGLLEAIENAGSDMNIVTASSCVEMIAFGAGAHDHEEGEDHDHEEGEDHEGEADHEEGEDHEHEGEMAADMGDLSAVAVMCEQHYAEMDAIHDARHEDEGAHEDEGEGEHAEGEDHDHEHEHHEVETLGALYAIDCGEGHEHEGEGEHAEDEEHEEGEEHDHAHGSCDPHVWTEPHNVMYWTMLIRDTLIELDPANADAYTANAEAYLLELDALAHDFIMPLVDTVPEDNRVLVTNHEAFGYFAARHDFEVATTIIPGGGTATEPSAADVAAVIDLIRDENVPAIFAETTVSDSLAEQIAAETGAEIFVLYSGSLSDADGPASTYLDFMRYNVTTIVDALGGSITME